MANLTPKTKSRRVKKTTEETILHDRICSCIQTLYADLGKAVPNPDFKAHVVKEYLDAPLSVGGRFVIRSDFPELDRKAQRAAKKIWDSFLIARAQPEEKEKLKSQQKIEKDTEKAIKKQLTREQEAARELAQRELSKRHLLPFVMRFTPGYQPGWVHKIICAELEKFEQDIKAKRSPRLMIAMPPRHGKSQIASVCYPAWFMGRNPSMEIIAASYATSLSLIFSRKARGMVGSKEFKDIFPRVALDPENKSAESWMTTQAGAYVASGIGSGITGKGAHLGIIDDPVKDRTEADSETTREGVKDWYSSTFYTRLAPGGGVLVIQTRWHEDDLSGWLESRMQDKEDPGADNWRIVKFPAFATEDERYRKKGDALHPDRYDNAQLKQIKSNMLPRDWAALYQQSPVADEGAYFKREFFKYYDTLPDLNSLNIYSAFDLAIGKKETNDYTVGVTVGVDEHDRIFVLNLVRVRFDALEIVDLILTTYDTWKPLIIGIERGQIELSIQPILEKRMRERSSYPSIEKLLPGRQDKEARARSIQGRLQQGLVFFPKHAGWLEAFEHEMLMFPAGRHDDQVDAIAWIGQLLSTIVPPKKARVAKLSSWRDRLRKYGLGSNYKSAMSA